MRIAEFEKRAVFNGGYDRAFGVWKCIDVHQISDSIKIGQEFDFYCSNGVKVFLLRIRLVEEGREEKLTRIKDRKNHIIWLIAEVYTSTINNAFIDQLLARFKKKNKYKM